jgi:hypothetical protein
MFTRPVPLTPTSLAPRCSTRPVPLTLTSLAPRCSTRPTPRHHRHILNFSQKFLTGFPSPDILFSMNSKEHSKPAGFMGTHSLMPRLLSTRTRIAATWKGKSAFRASKDAFLNSRVQSLNFTVQSLNSRVQSLNFTVQSLNSSVQSRIEAHAEQFSTSFIKDSPLRIIIFQKYKESLL